MRTTLRSRDERGGTHLAVPRLGDAQVHRHHGRANRTGQLLESVEQRIAVGLELRVHGSYAARHRIRETHREYDHIHEIAHTDQI